MDQLYSKRRQSEKSAAEKATAEQQPSLAALRSGAARPTAEQLGNRVDLPDAMRSKMENAFGADLSAVKLYESQTVADVGSKAITQGSDIAFAPGLVDFSSYGGQALLGHEISHVVSQARGEVTGSGFLNDASLEARADREGAMAAAGETVAMPSASLSPVTAAAAAGPMQAKVKPWEKKAVEEEADLPQEADLAKGEEESEASGERTGSDEKITHLIEEELDENGYRILREDPPPIADEGGSPARADTDTDGGSSTSSPPVTDGSQTGAPGTVDASKGWQFSSGKKKLLSSGIGFVLGMDNMNSPHRGKQFRQMMEALKPLAIANQHRDRLGGAYDPMMLSAYDKAISSMEAYKTKLASEWWVSKEERERQTELLDGYIAAAREDKASTEALKATTLTTAESTGEEASGLLNTVRRFVRGGQGAFFKQGKEMITDPEEYGVARRVGIRTGFDSAGEIIDPRLSQREIAFSRLGGLLGTSVASGAKMATSEKGKSGVLMEEAPGRSWTGYNWRYLGIPDIGRLPDATALDVIDSRSRLEGDTVGDRLSDAAYLTGRRMSGFDFTDARTTDPSFRGHGIIDGVFPAEPAPAEGTEPDADTPAPAGTLLDATAPEFQRQMNEMFLLDTLAGQTDRHAGNFMIGSSGGKISVKAIDNDLTFGALGDGKDARTFGKRGQSFNYGGLPELMQIDAKIAGRIRTIDREALDRTFSDLLSTEEIDALDTRFQKMREYVKAMEEAGLLVEQWDQETAKREFSLAGGIGSHNRETATPGVFRGNNYYQRQMMMLNAAARQNKDRFLQAAGYGV